MKKQKWIRKGMAFVLSFAMVAGLVPAMSGGANTVQAASGTGTELSVSAYATKTQLMDDTFAPKADGTAENYGKIVFGKKSDGKTAQEWHILGKDGGVSGGDNNTIIFAASPIATGKAFSSSTSNKTFDPSFGVYASNPSEVFSNHYGASELRVTLQRMLEDESGNAVETYFTTAEQDLMNATTVTTKDTKDSATYTTTDKLYALAADGSGDSYKTIKAGTSGSTVLAMSSYWSSGDEFWLRSPNDDFDYTALLAIPGNYVGYFYVDDGFAVQPASNLNLSSVLFASAATAASSDTAESYTIALEAAMTLRLDGTGKNIGTVTYNATTGDIKVAKGSTSQTVALVVQGKGTVNGEEKDWYYSKQITGTDTVNVSDIEAETYTPTSIDLSACKIWLEITDKDGMIYAVNADKEIEKINTTYVTKEQLMNSFKPYSDGTAVNTGKLVFGKKSDGTTAQQWYILGKDTGVSGDNTIIFAASPIATGQLFNSSKSDKTYNYEAGTGYGEPEGSTTVAANHYGASDLRVALQGMATNTSYFTSAEQGLMNATTVTTKDTKIDNTYTTTDKLYALAADGSGSSYKTIKAGTSGSTVLAMSSYWSRGDWFWLRSPYDDIDSFALLAGPGNSVGGSNVNYGYAVQPASNLNLSSVLFASAATAASSDTAESYTIALEAAMTLRLDGTGKDIGTVTYNTTTGDIKAVKGSTSQTVALVVQGNDGTNDWYYSKKIDAAETVNASDIKSALKLSSDIDLSACKIWLETTDTDGMIYAVGATEVITSVEITDIDTPVSNTVLDTEASCATTGVSSTTPQITWTPSDSIAGYNTSYTASITLTAGTGYEFINSTTATVLGNTATSVTKNADGTLTVTYAFPATAKRVIGSVTAPKVPTNNIFTTYYGYEGYDISPVSESNSELGTQATVTFTDSVNPNTEAMDVTWSIANAGGAAYDKTPGAKNTFRWTIPATALTNYSATDCQGYDATTGTITGTVTITNKDYTPVTITGENVTVTYDGKNTLDVSQYFTIDKNAGTPTYELSDTSTGTGTLDGATLTMTTLGTFVVKVSTPINGVYNTGEHTLTITVNKATPDVETLPTVDDRTYHPSNTLVDGDLKGGTVYGVDGKALAGTWNWKTADVIPTVGNSGYEAVFIPDDTANYKIISKTITVNVAKATPYIKIAPTAAAITYGETLAKATITGGSVQYSSTDDTAVDGTFAWKVDTTKPAVADSDKTAYTVVFTPTNENYNTVETDITVTVNKADAAPNKPNNTMEVDYGKEKVSDITTLPEGWAWKDADKENALTVATPVTATAVYTGADKGNYATESVEISITRQECTHATTEVRNAKDATCTGKGYSGDTYCKVCGKKVKIGQDINALGHEFSSEFTVDVAPTCAVAGSKSRHCTRCDETTDVTVIDKLTTHSYVNGVCSVCDDIFKTTVDGVTYQVMTETGADGKPFGKLVTVSGNEIPQVAVAVIGTGDDFAVSDGKVTVPSEITGSGSEQTFVVTKLSENAFNGASVTEVVVPATVTEVGTGAFGTASTITFKGNTAPSGIAGAITETVTTVNVPEGAADSYREELDENTNIVEVHTHTFDTKWTYDDTYHWHASTCGHETEVSDKAEHTFGEWTVTKEATEDAEGVKERSCSCGYKETAKIDKLAHTIHVKDEGIRVEPTCEEKGSITYKCTKCGEVMKVVELDATGHKWDAGKVTKEATETAEGVKTYTCSVCGKTKTEAIPKKTATTQEPPKKGDVVKDDKTSVKIEVTDVKKKEVEYKEPANKKAKTVSIPATVKIDGVTYKVTKVDDNAFKNNKTVTKVTVGSNIKTIGKNAFYKCTKLKTVKIGKNVTTIGSNAFKGCTSLTSVTLPSKATKIGANAFSGCKKLKTIKITSTKLTSKTVAKNAFKGLTKATTIKVPKKKLSAYKKLFKQKGLSSKVTVKGY